MPAEYRGLGLTDAQRTAHIGWDIGAAAVTEGLAASMGAAAVLSGASRLLIDCNRDLGDADLIPALSHGTVVPGNTAVDEAERARRRVRFYDSFHDAVDRVLTASPDTGLLSLHTFTPSLNGNERLFDVGVLFDDFESAAVSLAAALTDAGFRVRLNEPYSAFDGLIYSARRHGRRHGVRYLELEINNRLAAAPDAAWSLAARLGPAVAALAMSSPR